MNDPIAQFGSWVQQLPTFTKCFIGVALVLSLLSTTKVVSYEQYYFTPILATQQFELWRVFTTFLFFRNLSFGLLVSIYFSLYFLTRVERELFGGSRRADFLMFLIFTWVLSLLLGGLFGVPFLSESFTTSLTVVWCHYRKHQNMALPLGLSMENGYFPYVFVGFSVLFGQPLIVMVTGIIVAILYILVKDTIRTYYRLDLLKAPQFLKSKLNSQPTPNERIHHRTGVRIGEE